MRDRTKEFTNGPCPDSGTQLGADPAEAVNPAKPVAPAGATPPPPAGDPASGDTSSTASAPSSQNTPSPTETPCPSGASGESGAAGGERNAFSLPFLERLRGEEHPPTPEAANAGPWSVERVEEAQAPEAEVVCHHVDALESRTLRSETEWACVAAGEAGPRGTFERADLAYLFAAALPLDGAPGRLRLNRQALDPGLCRSGRAGGGAAGWYRVTEDGRPVGRLSGFRPELVGLADALVHLRSRPLALAHFLAGCGEETLVRTGRILDSLVRKGVA